MITNAKQVLGHGVYTAHWVARSNLVKLSATGLLPCSNYVAQLEKRPGEETPPSWNLVFYVEDICEKGLASFNESVVMMNMSGAQTVVVHDALGAHEIPINDNMDAAENHDGYYVVYASFPKPVYGHQGCEIVPQSAIVTADRYRAFGPATYEFCQEFIADHQYTEPNLVIASGEIPWPLLA